MIRHIRTTRNEPICEDKPTINDITCQEAIQLPVWCRDDKNCVCVDCMELLKIYIDSLKR